MELIPAIDILDGKVVRLYQGDFAQVTNYADDPVEQAKRFAEQGAKRIHVVDLDGAKTGELVNQGVIGRMLAEVPAKIQVGGGVRDRMRAELWLEKGVDRVVIGTLAIKEPQEVKALCLGYPNRIVIAIDIKDGLVATHGWASAKQEALGFAEEVSSWQPAAVLCTDIARDGTSEGPNVKLTVLLQDVIKATVIASGGIGTLDHLRDLAASNVRAAVCGRALYAGAFTYSEALQAIASVP